MEPRRTTERRRHEQNDQQVPLEHRAIRPYVASQVARILPWTASGAAAAHGRESGRGDGQRKGRTLAVAPPQRDVSWSMPGRGGGVVSSAGVPPLIGTASRRRRALAHLSPIFDL